MIVFYAHVIMSINEINENWDIVDWNEEDINWWVCW